MAGRTQRQEITALITDKRGKVLAVGKNSYAKTHPHQKRMAAKVGMVHREFLHAEIAAITRCRNLDDAHKITVYRVKRNGKYGLAKPCPVCSAAIEAAGIKHVSWTVDDSEEIEGGF